MAIGDVIVGIDIGASKISLVVGEVNNFNQIEVICNTSSKSNGIQKDKIVDENSLAEAISNALDDAEKEINMKINSAYITIPGKYITIVHNSVTKEAKDKYSHRFGWVHNERLFFQHRFRRLHSQPVSQIWMGP